MLFDNTYICIHVTNNNDGDRKLVSCNMSTYNRQHVHKHIELRRHLIFGSGHMSEALKTTVRLKKQEAVELRELAFSLTKKAIMKGKQKIYSESDLVHYMIENAIKNIDIDEEGNLYLK